VLLSLFFLMQRVNTGSSKSFLIGRLVCEKAGYKITDVISCIRISIQPSTEPDLDYSKKKSIDVLGVQQRC